MHRRLAALLTVVLLAVPLSAAQGLTAGVIPFSTGVGSAYDRLDPATSNIIVTIPVRNKIGKIPFSFELVSQSHAYVYTNTAGTKYWAVSSGFVGRPFAGDMGATLGFTQSSPTCNGQTDTELTNFFITDATGAIHALPTSLVIDLLGCVATHATAMTQDGSGYTASVQLSSGTSVCLPCSTIYDRSGNQLIHGPSVRGASSYTVYETDPDGATIQATTSKQGIDFITGYTDTLGATALTYDEDKQSYSYTDGSGLNQAFTINNTLYYQKTVFGCQNITDIDSGGVNQSFPTSISTPVGAMEIGYEQTPNYPSDYTTGRIAQITFPTGGSVQYSYSGGNHGINCTSGVVPELSRSPNYGNNQVSASGYFNSNVSGGTGAFTVVETDQANNQTVHYFWGEFQTFTQAYQGGCLPTSIYGCNGGGTLLRAISTCYNGNLNNGLGGCQTPTLSPPKLPITQTDVYTWVGVAAQSLVETTFDAYGNTTKVSRYDWGAAIPPASGPSPVSTENISYTGCGVSASLYIFDKPCSDTVTDSTGSQFRQTNAKYSSTGHPTEIDRWVSGTGSNSEFLKSYASYGTGTNGVAAGVLSSVTDVNGAPTSFANFVCNSMFSTTVNYPLSLSTSQTWDSGCNGGVVESSTDMNQNPTTYTYADPLWRMTSVTNQNYPAVNFSYADPNHSETYMNFNGSVSTVDTTTTVDGLGRPILVQKRQGQGSTSFDSVQYQYYWANTGNVAGAFTEQSLPYSGSGSPVSTTTQYDAVGRPAITTDPGGGKVNYTYSGNDVLQTIELPPGSVRKQFEYDGLGRLTSVCELTVGTTAWPGGSCKQTFGQTGYWTTYTYDALGHLKSVTQNAQGSPTQTRSYYYDGLGRLTQESNPESGTTWYFWDAAPSACGSGGWSTPGDLGAKKDNAGVYNCYGYDTLHRLVGFGPLSIIPNKNCTSLVYDAPQSGWPPPSGSNLQNTKGRLIEAYTNTNCDGHTSIVTDEWYGYSPRGEVTDIYTSTPNSNGYYHVGKSYWANGALRTLTGIPGVPTITYGADGEGRPTTVTAGSQNLVTTTSYNAASQVTGVTLGSGDSDSYTYDSATDRMTQYSFHVGGSSLVGKLTWNINGTLGALSIADPFNSTNQQNCTYAYDDLARLGGKDANGYSVDCGATWAQTFTLDPFGNILKTGNSSWNPNYASPPNNQYMLGWSGISYDADGHLTNDTFHTYQWDANGHAIGIGPISPLTTGSPSPQSNQTFDALGNLVEQNIPSDNWTAQYLHDEHGAELGFAHAQAAGWTWIRLPGGATAIYVGGSLQNYWHADWMGSARFGSTPSQGMFSDRAFAPYGEPYASAGSSYQSFAGLLQNLSADLFDTPNREYHPTQGRWISPDPAGLAAVDPSNPQTWNRYAYVRNNPVRSIDPSGLCDVVIGGITQSSMDPGAAGLTSFANSIGADLVFPYQNGSTFGGVLDVAGQGLGLPNAASLAVVAAINQAAGDPGPINVFTFSGGAQAFNSALGYLPVDVQARINNVTYVSPGALSDLAPGNGNTTVISNSSGGYDPYIFAGSYGDASLMNTDCAHRSNCTFPQQTPFLVSQAGSGCSATTTFSRSHGLLTINPAWFGAGGFGGFGAGWNEFDLLSLYFGTVESVTHRIY